ncbi:Specifically methylates the N3 position of the uracil ring of uridine 1498 (m3U1498) in 16S rRNA. Acts on the fully assembled 30S ribosomal subunit (By similarity) [Seminavis robusta]|uniref:16S rRNA (uracil(1498)-N(3))-methyltransferase n=1 Tax=Seminavis robusta TaxID=568900 RepID=A0A9N8DLW0_9STRA|nr:Specifically methylates the N3 position of the uracil ring of uridine 1498 (m3U1498) in 16S rRNA. Acts on the fully assembled 30S ribosomal subunit (By similarity) [Seminavis robusta]|eukprot:Sro216_g089380.1 Specifically methylates the N3 position of the uracil ring of uridine 1498 (m3U1498) in 16S rRNA. Acts on the fully assembled 30S ribosomal subunit (By similarity) (351) ;mRNA; r:42496-43548
MALRGEQGIERPLMQLITLFQVSMILQSFLAFRSAASFTAHGRFGKGIPLTRHHQIRHLNRFLFDPEEVLVDDNATKKYVTLSKDDYRTIHASKILGLHNGDTLRAGVVGCSDLNGTGSGGYLTDHAVVEWIPEGKVKKAEPLGNGNPPGSLRIELSDLSPCPDSQVPTVALLLALPRPLQLGRMLPMIAQMGVSHLILSQAKKVPKDYFGSHLFRKPHLLRERLIEGLCQAGDVRLPNITIVKNLKHFLAEDIDEMFPLTDYARVIAHPQRKEDDEIRRMRNVEFPTSTTTTPRILMAVGPEGGWEEPEELDRFQELGFQQITMGNRVLRSDCAVVSLLALAHDACSND